MVRVAWYRCAVLVVLGQAEFKEGTMSFENLSAQEILAKLVSFNTISDQSNLPLIEWVEAYLDHYGVKSKRFQSNQAHKACLWACVGDATIPPVVLSGHTDVVPVVGQDWHTDPFVLTEKDGLLYGRGTCDMKGFLACALSKVPQMVAEPLSTPIAFALSYDEEIGCRGVLDLVNELGESLPLPKLVWVGEPTSMKIVNQHKTCVRFRTQVFGKESHSSRTDIGVNALAYASRIAVFLDDLNREIFANSSAGEFDLNYTTIHVGILNAGLQVNIIPNFAELWWEMRVLPSENYQTYLDKLNIFTDKCNQELQLRDENCRIIHELSNITQGLAAENQSVAENYLKQLSGENASYAAAYATEAGHFQAKGASTVIIGPGRIDEAHRPNEYIAISQIALCLNMLDKLIMQSRR